MTAGLSPLKKEVPQTTVEWLDKNFKLPEGSSQISGNWTTQPAQFALANMMGNDAIKVFCLRKPTRFGYTKLLAGVLWYLGVHKKRSSVLYHPTDPLAKSFGADEINPLLPIVPAIQKVFPDWAINNENNKLLKKVCNGFSIDIRGAETPNNFRALTKQVVAGDEITAWKVNSGEGDNMKVLIKRIQGAAFGKAIFGATAAFADDVMERLLAEMPCLFEFHLPCPHCGTKQVLEWGDKDSDNGIKWDNSLDDDEAKAHSAFYSCISDDCRQSEAKGRILYRHLYAMEENGIWVCKNTGIWTKNGIQFYNQNGAKITAPKRVGIEVSALYSQNLMEGWAELVLEWLDIKGDSDKLQVFWNLTLGLPWNPTHTKRRSYKTVKERREPYKAQVPKDVVYLVAGGDTQDNRMEAYVWGFTANERKYLIDRFYLLGDPRDKSVQDGVVEFCKREYQTEDGRTLKIARVCWDTAGHRTQVIYALSKRIGLLKFIPIRGANSYQQPVQQMPDKPHPKNKTFLTQVGTDTAKDHFYSDLDEPLNEPRAIHFPLDERICNDDVCKQLVSEVRVPKKTKYGTIFVYDNEKRRNEALDCYVYALAALYISIERFGLNLQSLANKDHEKLTTDSFAELGRKLGAS